MPTQPDPRLFQPQCHELRPVVVEHENQWFTVYNRGGRYTVEYTQQHVIILPVVDQHSVVMVKVKRPVICDSPLELPAGAIEKGETSSQGALRELAEETGICLTDAARFKPLPPISSSPNRSPMLYHVVRIDLTQAEFDQRQKHDAEIDGVVLMNRDQLTDAMHSGEIYVVSALAVIACHFLLPGCTSGNKTRPNDCQPRAEKLSAGQS